MLASYALNNGIRINKVASITNKGRDGDSIVVEVCVDYTRGEGALEGFRIVPIGEIFAFIERPLLIASFG